MDHNCRGGARAPPRAPPELSRASAPRKLTRRSFPQLRVSASSGSAWRGSSTFIKAGPSSPSLTHAPALRVKGLEARSGRSAPFLALRFYARRCAKPALQPDVSPAASAIYLFIYSSIYLSISFFLGSDGGCCCRTSDFTIRRDFFFFGKYERWRGGELWGKCPRRRQDCKAASKAP